MSRVRDTGSSPGLASLASNQRYSDDQLAILQQAAAILNIPVTALPNTLRAASSSSSTPAASPDSSLSAAEHHHGACASDPNAHQWASTTNNLAEDWNYGVPATQAQSQSQMQPLRNGVAHGTKHLLRTPVIDGSPGCDILREFEEELSRPRPPNAPRYNDESTASLNRGLSAGPFPSISNATSPDPTSNVQLYDRSTTFSFTCTGEVAKPGEENLNYYSQGFSTYMQQPSVTNNQDNLAGFLDYGVTTSTSAVYDFDNDFYSVSQAVPIPNLSAYPGFNDNSNGQLEYSNNRRPQDFLPQPSPSLSSYAVPKVQEVYESLPIPPSKTLSVGSSPSASSQSMLDARSDDEYSLPTVGPSLPQETTREVLADAAAHGPCSNTWKAPKQRKNSHRSENDPRGRRPTEKSSTPRRRGAFRDQQTRQKTALTRQLKACIRCRFQRIRCEPDPNDPHNSCLTCMRVATSTLSGLPCLRYKITDASLYREQSSPWQQWSQRWTSMDIRDITEWASPVIKTIRVSHGFGKASYTLEVRQFIPIKGDSLEEQWSDRGIMKKHKLPPFAIADMRKAAITLRRYVDESMLDFIGDGIDYENPLIFKTYRMAYKHALNAPREDEKTLLTNTLRLWVAARMTSNPEWILGEETLGIPTVEDPASVWHKNRPKPPVMCAQCEVISYSTLLRPFKKEVLSQLQAMILANKRSNWFTIYLSLFLLLHSCAMITRRDEEYARQILLQTRFANPESIKEHHMGALTMLAHFHYLNKGNEPFALAGRAESLQDLAEAAGLNAEQMELVKETSVWIKQNQSNMKQLRQETDFGNDHYFVSQLYDKDWKPGPTA